MVVREAPPKPYGPGRPRQMFVRDDSSYQPTKTELEEDMRIPDATPEKLAQALFGNHSRRGARRAGALWNNRPQVGFMQSYSLPRSGP